MGPERHLQERREGGSKFSLPLPTKTLSNLKTIVTASIAARVRNNPVLNIPKLKHILDNLHLSTPQIISPLYSSCVQIGKKLKDQNFIVTGVNKGFVCILITEADYRSKVKTFQLCIKSQRDD